MQLEARLRAFAAVARQGSFSLAAREIHVSQPAVSKQVAALEAELGRKLVERRRDGARLTPAGKALAEYALRAEALLANARRALVALDDAEAGSVRVAASGIPADYLLPGLLPAFLARFPRITVDIHASTSEGALELVRSHEAELGVVGGFTTPPELESEPLFEDEIVLIGPPALASRRLRVSELERLTWVMREEGSATRAAVETTRWQLGLQAVRVIETSSWEAVKRIVEAGGGIAAISRAAVEHELAAGRLGLLDVPRWRLRRTISLVTARDVPLTPSAARFRTALRGLTDAGLRSPEQVDRGALDGLGVFSGGFDAAAAEHVCDVGQAQLARLVELGRLDRDGSRYTLDEAQSLSVPNDVARRHAEFFAALAEESALRLSSPGQSEWSTRLGQERPNVRTAVAWAEAHGEWELVLRLLGPCWKLWLSLGYPPEWQRALEGAYEGVDDARLRLLALPTLGWRAFMDRSFDAAEAYARERVELARAVGDHGSVGGGFNLLAVVAGERGEHDRARSLIDEAVAYDRVSGDDEHLIAHLLNLSGLALERGDLVAAEAATAEATTLARARGDATFLHEAAYLAAATALLRNDPRRALQLLLETVPGPALMQRADEWAALELVGISTVLAGHPRDGIQILAGAERRRVENEQVRSSTWVITARERAEAAARAVLGAEAYDAACCDGAELDLGAALALVRSATV